ncbi:AAA family ATPase [Paludicola sp. MB14-C6]|uniref:AAA family ATPase n=1 Tax=Paludihabitans sp. MB14-C6 TaxID=3070656 RepID=UPI0027DCD193|nr:AAA family ATPase [Paludicola sp. MB14-C6]WMJ23140.1 AAA family ATPase [Paludicola sp. MB14-C6]
MILRQSAALLMNMNYNVFPFAAIVGQEKIKKALILNLINPNIGGVLISGEKGTAKSTLVRGLADLMENTQLINLPLNITEDRLVGSIDIKKAILHGKKVLDSGLLQKANGNILYIDEVNLLSEHIVNILLEVSSTGENIIEREGLSYRFPSKFVLVGSMNPEEGFLRSQFIDRFGLFVLAEGEKDKKLRFEIIKRRLEYENNPIEFCKKWSYATNLLKLQIEAAKKLFSIVNVTKENLVFASSLAYEAKCAGHRAEITIIETAKAIAAYSQNTIVTEDYLEEAAKYVLPHRMRKNVNIEDCCNSIENDERDIKNNQDNCSSTPPNSNISNTFETSNENTQDEVEEKWEDIAKTNEKLNFDIKFSDIKKATGSGKRAKVKINSTKGRYVKYCFPKAKVTDIAFDATIRSAVTHKNNDSELMISIRDEDIRQKVREQRTGATILFLVDASGSMGAQRRMGAVKGTILSLLNDAYQKRDLIGMIAFRKETAETLLNITRSVDLAQKCLKNLKTGGKSPLALGLYKAYEILKAEKIKNPQSLQYLVIVTDGKANIPLFTSDSMQDAFNIGEKIHNEGIESLILDTENGYIKYGFAENLSKKMGSEYIKIHCSSECKIKESVMSFMKTK